MSDLVKEGSDSTEFELVQATEPVQIGETTIFRQEYKEDKRIEVTHLTPVTAEAYTSMYNSQYAVPAQEKTKQEAEVTKREMEHTKQVSYQVIAETVKQVVTIVAATVCVVVGLYVVLHEPKAGWAVGSIVGVIAAFAVANSAVNKFARPKPKPLPQESNHPQLPEKR